MKVELTQDEIDLILYCLDQQQYEFNGNEEEDFVSICKKFNTASFWCLLLRLPYNLPRGNPLMSGVAIGQLI